MMKPTNKTWILAAAVGGILSAASYSQAQFRVDTGHANDASNRLGSGGFNAGGDGRVGRGPLSGVTGNDIVTGNVTGGKEFHGAVPYTDPRAFRGTLPELATDQFIRGSSGTPYGGYGGENSNANTVRTFLGDSRGVTPPSGFVRNNIGTGGYVQAPPEQRLPSDLRLGNPFDFQTIPLPAPGQTILPGPLDPTSNSATLITASSLYGVRQWNAGNDSDQEFVARYANQFGQPINRNNLSDSEINAIRQEMQQAAGLPNANLNGPSNQVGTNTAGQSLNAAPQNSDNRVPQPLNAPNNAPVTGNPLQSTGQTNPLPGDLSTGESFQLHVLGVAPAAQQSDANDVLEKRYEDKYGKQAAGDLDAANKYNKDMQAKAAAAAKQNPTDKSTTPTTPNEPSTPTPDNKGSAPQTAPPVIKSFASGVKAKGLADLLKKSEDLMKEGKWSSAVQEYDLARQVAPNNMLVSVGRANADLGGAFYAQAEVDLRTAFTQDPSTLEGQYDLRSMIGEDRLQFLAKDLKEIAAKNPTQSRPIFLLAYIAYNTSNERMAAGYLDLAEKRAGTNDTFYSLVRKHWTLPAKGDASAPELNK